MRTLLLVLLGCSSPVHHDDAGAPGTGHPMDASADAPKDAPTGAGAGTIMCGAATCNATSQTCCDLPPPSTDYCFSAPNICEGGHALHCDGSEDCPQNEVCCYGDGASCGEAPVCRSGGAKIMCHGSDTSPCLAGEHCCPLTAGSPYSVCKPSC